MASSNADFAIYVLEIAHTLIWVGSSTTHSGRLKCYGVILVRFNLTARPKPHISFSAINSRQSDKERTQENKLVLVSDADAVFSVSITCWWLKSKKN